MKKKIIALISGAVILIIAAGSIYGKSESGHKEGEPDVVGTLPWLLTGDISRIEKLSQENFCRCTRMILFIRQNSPQTGDMRQALI